MSCRQLMKISSCDIIRTGCLSITVTKTVYYVFIAQVTRLHGYTFLPLSGNLQVTKIHNIKTNLSFYFCMDRIRSQSVGVIRICICNTQELRSQPNHMKMTL